MTHENILTREFYTQIFNTKISQITVSIYLLNANFCFYQALLCLHKESPTFGIFKSQILSLMTAIK